MPVVRVGATGRLAASGSRFTAQLDGLGAGYAERPAGDRGGAEKRHGRPDLIPSSSWFSAWCSCRSACRIAHSTKGLTHRPACRILPRLGPGNMSRYYNRIQTMFNDKHFELSTMLFEKSQFPEIELEGITESAENPNHIWGNIVMPGTRNGNFSCGTARVKSPRIF